MKTRYTFLLQNTGLRYYNRIANIITLLNLLFFSWLAFFAHTLSNRYVCTVIAVVIAAFFIHNLINKKHIKAKPYFFAGGYLFFAVSFLFISSNYLLAALQLLLAVADVIARQPIYLHIDDAGITQQQWKFKKKYGWALLGHVVLKDGLLTLDFKNNAIRYFTISTTENEADFNAYCMQRMQAA
ncbi:MAG TPA: hypothetical protein PKC39_04530 [Ferruginibacter sp.]|nr:hypothetical protein [Ferruginibacter sp.]HMP20206.1 hypothetical protein [Ferruginibacter sp.]